MTAVKLERLGHRQDDHGDQDQHRELVEPAVPDVAVAVVVVFEVCDQFAAVNMVGDECRDEGELGVQPAAADAVAEPEPGAEDNCQYRARGHDAVEELALHDLEALAADAVVAHGVVHEQAREIEQPGEPGDHENNVQRLEPEHDYFF